MEEDKTNICNIVPSPFDPRDWEFEGITLTANQPNTPKQFICDNLRPVKSQGSRGTCVAMSLSCVKEYQETVDNSELFREDFSPNSLYFYRSTENGGMYCRNALKILQEKGMCREDLFPYTKKKEPKKIPKEAVKEALEYRIKSYAQVHTIDGVKAALLNYGPLLAAFPYYKNGKAEFWVKPSLSAPLDGGHAVALVGWNEKGFIIRNSWGKGWNGDGHVLYPYSQWGSHWEIWSCIDLDTNYLPKLRKKHLFTQLCCL